jgi:hypothetical protein
MEYKTIFQYDKLEPLLKAVDGLNPKQKKASKVRGSLGHLAK